jgi:hypothetical protein
MTRLSETTPNDLLIDRFFKLPNVGGQSSVLPRQLVNLALHQLFRQNHNDKAEGMSIWDAKS